MLNKFRIRFLFVSFLVFGSGCVSRSLNTDIFDETAGDVIEQDDSELTSTPTYDFKARTGITKAEINKPVPGLESGIQKKYGLSRVKPVLRGVVYRGGVTAAAPLSEKGKKSLCDFGFKAAIYGYSGSPSKGCLEKYEAHSPNSQKEMEAAMKLIREAILYPEHGPVYVHCWGGNHASGAIAAISLIQFCNYSKSAALDYWEINRNNVHADPSYKNITVGDYVRQTGEGWEIPADVQKKICPH